jgi:hypothetical protein
MSAFGVDPDRVWAAAQELRALVAEVEQAGREVPAALHTVAAAAGQAGLRRAADTAAVRWGDAVQDLGRAGSALAVVTDVAAEGYDLVESLAQRRLTPVTGLHR